MRWFHGTSKQNAEKILKEGVLKPGQSSTYDIDIPRDNAVYIADWDVAHQYALERNGVILEVATPNPKKLIPDEDDVYELLSDHKGHLNTQGQGLQQRIQALWLQKWNEENAAYRTEYSEEQFPHYENFEQAWEAWGEIEFEGSAELAEQMKDLTDYIVKKDPALAQAVIQMSGKAAHLGPIKVIGKAPKQASAAQIEKLKPADIEEALQVGSDCFGYGREVFEGISRSELDNDFSQCYVAKIDGQIVGGYFLGRHQLPEQYAAPETEPYEGKKGIEGVALFVLPKFRGSGLGRQLRAIPLSLGADYIWGQHFEDLNNLQNWVNFGRKHLFTIGDVHVTVMDLKPEKTAAKKPEYIKTVGFVIEVPHDRRKTFWTRPEGKLEYWAFKNRPRAFISEPIIFTFDRKPVAQAVVLRVEAPGKGEGEYKDWHKLYWNPRTFVKYRTITAAAKKAGWIGPVYHGSSAGFGGNPKGDPEAAGMTYFTDSAEYAGYFSSSHGQYVENSAIYPAYIRLGKPFDARDWSDQKLTIEEYAKAIGATKAALLNEIPTLPTETWFWRYLLMTPHTSKAALKEQGYDSIIQLEAEDRGQTPHTTSFVVFNNTQIKSLTGDKAPKKVLDLTGKEAAASISQLAMNIEKLHDEIKNNPAYEMVRPSDRQQVDLLRLMMRNIPVMIHMAKSFGNGKLLKVKWNPEREETIGTQIEYWTEMFKALKEQADQPGVLRDAQRVIQLIAQFDEIVYSIHRLIEMLVDKPSRYFRRTSAAPAPAQQKVTDTPEFKRWFGNSKVVDANGEPLVVYHGSTRDYDTFSLTYPYRWEWTPIKDLGYVGRGEGRSEALIFNNKQQGTFSLYPDGGEFNTAEEAMKKVDAERPKQGLLSMRPGFFFAANPMYTRDFTKSYDSMGGTDPEGGHIKPCYLKMENPLDFRDPKSRRWVRGWLRSHRDQMGELDVNHIYKMFREGNWAFVEGLESVMADEQINPAQLVSDIKAAGFDGYINVEGGILQFVGQTDEEYASRAEEMYGRGGLDSSIVYVVWEPNQIKSAIGNSGAFDPDNPSITASSKKADHINDEGFWAGEGNAASGVLPICPTTGNVCLAMRSSEVLSPNCWGTIGGAVQRGMSPRESAKTEMAEETGYHGGITLIPAFVFAAAGGFKYHNFIGVVPNEFSFNPSEEHSWETDFIQWMPYAEVVKDMQTNPSDYHPGLIALFKNSKQVIERVMKVKQQKSEEQEKTSASTSPELEAFMDDFRTGTGSNPLGMRDRVWGENVVIEVRPFDGKIHISDIMSLERGQGNASKALDWLCSLADKHGVKMSLTPDAYGDEQGLDNDQLSAWYAKRGFKFVRGQLMVREPRTTLKLGPNMKTIPMDKTSSHSPACRCEMCRSIEQWRRPWLTGKCHEFALALSTLMPDAQFVAIGNAMFDHVGLRKGDTYYDVRGAMSKAQFAELFGSNENSVHDVSREQVMKDAYPSYIGHEDELAGLPEFKAALKVVRRALGKNKTAGLQFQDTNRGYHNDQADQTLTALVDGKPVGYMEYAVYQDEPSVQWLEVFDKRKGYGTALLKELQRMYPDVEVDLGMLTDEGGKLIDSMKFNEQPTEYAAKFDELEQLIKERDKLQQVADDYYARENHSEEEKQSFMRQMENMNNIHDRIWELEQETSRQKRTKRYIAAEQQHLFPGSQDANFQAWFKGSKVVDKDGKPQPVYHGTRSSVDFDSFSVDGPPVDDSDYEGQPTSSGSGADPTAMMGAHFAVQPEVASQFATPARGRWQSTRYEGENEMPRVIQVFLRVTNPKDFGSEHNLREFINQGKVTGDALDIAMQGDGIQPYEDEEAASEWYQKYETDQAFRTEKNRYLFEQAPGGEGYDDDLRDAAYELAGQARGRLEAAGHDGVHYKNVVEGGTAWIIFDPRQAKSVWAQSFNPIDPRFTASVESDATEIKIVPKSKGLESEAWYQGERVGFVYLHKMEDAPGNPRAPKNSLMVDAAALAQHLKGKSVGLKMYRAGIDAAREAGYERVYEGIDHSEDAANLWVRLKQLYPTEFDDDWGVYYIPLKQAKTGAMLKIGGKATVLYLDDCRKPLRPGVAWAKNYDQFVSYLKNNEMPDVVSFDHDLALEHYPANWEEDRARFTEGIPYNTYHEKTGLDAAEWIVQQQLPLKFWAVHSANPVGRENIRQVLKFYCPDGEVQPNIPFINQEKSVYGGKVEGGYRVEPWEKKAAGFAFRSFKKLWHVGDMNPKSKRPGSYEGSGLSVSVNPEEWQYIAGIGGDLWELTKQSNRFLNFHRIGKQQKKQITEWGIKNGYVEPVTMWRAEWYDSENEDTRYSDYLTQQEAQEELEGNDDTGEGKVYEVPDSLNPTPKLLTRAHAGGGDNTMMAWDYLVIIYAEDMLQCDGVWWDDKLDQYALSAPRGVIFKDKLSSWKIRKVHQAAAAPKATPTQIEVLKGMMSGDGTIHRERGGFWLWWTPAGYDKWGSPLREGETSTLGREGVSWCDIRTVRAMEKRGWVERTMQFPEEWRDPRRITDAGQLLLMPAKTSADHSWNREQAEDFLRQLPLAEAGYTGKIVGGVAVNGQSSHDLDLVLTPITEDFDFEKLMSYFQSVGADQQPTHNGEEEIWEVRLPSGQIVDLFFTEEESVSPVN